MRRYDLIARICDHMLALGWGPYQNDHEDPNGQYKNAELGLSKAAYEFIGGVLYNAEAVCALTNPTINSFKRMHGMPALSGATWSPNTMTYTGHNRTHMIRIPDAGRVELRLADGSSNPYLLQATLIVAGLDGLAHPRDPGKRCDNNMYTSRSPPATASASRATCSMPCARCARTPR
jgi:glutamine synthetase